MAKKHIETIKMSYDNKLKLVNQFKEGDLVLLYQNELLNSKTKKTHPQYKGPFQITQAEPYGNYQLETLDGIAYQNVINESCLKRHILANNIEECWANLKINQ